MYSAAPFPLYKESLEILAGADPNGAVVIPHWYEQISPAETVLLLLLYPVFSVQSCWLIEFFFLQHFATFLQPPPTFLQPLINFL